MDNIMNVAVKGGNTAQSLKRKRLMRKTVCSEGRCENKTRLKVELNALFFAQPTLSCFKVRYTIKIEEEYHTPVLPS
jgi:hypothetical protein